MKESVAKAVVLGLVITSSHLILSLSSLSHTGFSLSLSLCSCGAWRFVVCGGGVLSVLCVCIIPAGLAAEGIDVEKGD